MGSEWRILFAEAVGEAGRSAGASFTSLQSPAPTAGAPAWKSLTWSVKSGGDTP